MERSTIVVKLGSNQESIPGYLFELVEEDFGVAIYGKDVMTVHCSSNLIFHVDEDVGLAEKISSSDYELEKYVMNLKKYLLGYYGEQGLKDWIAEVS